MLQINVEAVFLVVARIKDIIGWTCIYLIKLSIKSKLQTFLAADAKAT